MNAGLPEGISDGLVLPCGICHRRVAFDYTVTDDAWETVVPKHLRLGVLCLPCFDHLIVSHGGTSGDVLLKVQFVGVIGTTILMPEKTHWRDRR